MSMSIRAVTVSREKLYIKRKVALILHVSQPSQSWNKYLKKGDRPSNNH